MYANSTVPHSAQTTVHEQLPILLARHVAAPYQRPIPEVARLAFAASLAGWDGQRPLLLDAGCGTGASSLQLARQWPGHWVIGIDQSADRLARKKLLPSGVWPENLVLVRANLVDWWRLAVEAGLRLDRHYLLYPNPWPKIGQLQRRWHGHPVFPLLPQLGGVLECRSNWPIYIDELGFALNWLTGCPVVRETLVPATEALSPFERKYRDSGQTLYRCVLDFSAFTLACSGKAASGD